jgi:toxin ParE1/3/4
VKYEIRLTCDAARDVDDIQQYIMENDSAERAEYVVGQIEARISPLGQFPDRGSRPQELLEAGRRGYREIFFKPYRIIYRAEKKIVYIHLIADGRRNMQQLLTKRLVDKV